jgi:hypothetical protein
MDHNWAVEAIFEEAQKFTATITAPPGAVILNPSGAQYAGSDVTITALPLTGWSFDGWIGDFTGSETSFVWHVTGPATFKATYTTPITTTAAGPGHIELSPSLPRYEYGAQVEVIPVPDAGAELVIWGQDGAGKPLTEWTLTVTNAEPKISALFQAKAQDYSFSQPQLESGQLKFHLTGSPGTNVTIQSTTDFVTWTDGPTVTVQNGGTDAAIQIDQSAEERFFRLKSGEIP